MRIKRFFQKLMIRSKGRKDRMPKVSEAEKCIIDIFMTFLRKKDSILLKNNINKKVIIQNNNVYIWLNDGLLIIDDNKNINSILIPEIINNYLIREFNRIQNKKMYRAEVNISNNIDKKTNNLLKQIKDESTNNVPDSNSKSKGLLLG